MYAIIGIYFHGIVIGVYLLCSFVCHIIFLWLYWFWYHNYYACFPIFDDTTKDREGDSEDFFAWRRRYVILTWLISNFNFFTMIFCLSHDLYLSCTCPGHVLDMSRTCPYCPGFGTKYCFHGDTGQAPKC